MYVAVSINHCIDNTARSGKDNFAWQIIDIAQQRQRLRSNGALMRPHSSHNLLSAVRTRRATAPLTSHLLPRVLYVYIILLTFVHNPIRRLSRVSAVHGRLAPANNTERDRGFTEGYATSLPRIHTCRHAYTQSISPLSP